MKTIKFYNCIAHLLNDEGPYSNDPLDPGTETKWGITHKAWALECENPDENWNEFEIDDAVEWYWQHRWISGGYEGIKNFRITNTVFNQGILAGQNTVNKILQLSVNQILNPFRLKPDGIIGSITRTAINNYKYPNALLMLFKTNMTEHLINLHQPHFVEGWLNRLERL